MLYSPLSPRPRAIRALRAPHLLRGLPPPHPPKAPRWSRPARETANSSLGLKLTLSVNATTIPSQDAIDITASVLNTLPTANNLTASSAWAIDGLSAGPCDLGNATNKLYYPVGIGVFRGTYGLNNLSSAGKPLSCGPGGMSRPTASQSATSTTPCTASPATPCSPGSDNGTYAGYYAVPGAQPPPVCNSGVCTYTPNPETFAKGTFPTRMSLQEIHLRR